MFLSFTTFGMLPILGFIIVPYVVPSLDDHSLFLIACLITAVALFSLGAFKVRAPSTMPYRARRGHPASRRKHIQRNAAFDSVGVFQ